MVEEIKAPVVTNAPAVDIVEQVDGATTEPEIKKDEPEAVGENTGEAGNEEGKKVAPAGEVNQPVEPAKVPWWKEMGYVDEDAAVKSQKELRAHSTQTSQENAKLRRSEEALRKYHQGEIDTEDIDQYINEREAEIAKEADADSEKQQFWDDRVDLAIETLQVRHPEIVIDANIPILEAFFKGSDKTSPMEKMEDAVQMFKTVQASNVPAIKKAQDLMKAEASNAGEPPAGKQDKGARDYWEMSSEDFRKETDRVAQGLP